jgi:hypothetical protein
VMGWWCRYDDEGDDDEVWRGMDDDVEGYG